MDLTKTCAICQMPFEADLGAHYYCSKCPGCRRITSGCGDCAKPDGGCRSSGSGSSADEQPRIDMNKFLYNSCQVNLKDHNEESVAPLTPYVAKNVCDQSRGSKLLSQIKDFLTDDSDDEE
ncbi:hypothetical protein MBANPS3_003513 [Mucor bainieri]